MKKVTYPDILELALTRLVLLVGSGSRLSVLDRRLLCIDLLALRNNGFVPGLKRLELCGVHGFSFLLELLHPNHDFVS